MYVIATLSKSPTTLNPTPTYKAFIPSPALGYKFQPRYESKFVADKHAAAFARAHFKVCVVHQSQLAA